ncbi:hypothetical protein BDP27DRAFT_451096 [Rhodocollybia butyracea]|uniref:Uncharacterized protein n=1 Tax=Rhodocollybia butyracea TaxID=206335 RepID=A0A9P5PAG8_9AGAR|nr:hypothetical protein BDP27DRAFT_451096 [Rhodocollybia butyracea]
MSGDFGDCFSLCFSLCFCFFMGDPVQSNCWREYMTPFPSSSFPPSIQLCPPPQLQTDYMRPSECSCCRNNKLDKEIDELHNTQIRNEATQRHESRQKPTHSQLLDQPEENRALLASEQHELQSQRIQNREGSSQGQARSAVTYPPTSVSRYTEQPSTGPAMGMFPHRSS